MKPPWSQNQLKALGRRIRDGVENDSAGPTYGEVLAWYNELAAEAQESIYRYDWNELLGPRHVEITSRAKTVDTLREKLQRDRATPLASIQDLAGVRLEAEMSLDEQDAVARAIATLFGHDFEACVRDLRVTPHSGYRAVHLWLRLEGGRVEVQVRTHLQGAWANAYESAADAMGRGIRYDLLPADESLAALVQSLQGISTGRIAEMEAGRNTAERLVGEYSSLLSGLGAYGDDDTLPHEMVSAQEASIRILELRRADLQQEREVQDALMKLKSIFDDMGRKR